MSDLPGHILSVQAESHFGVANSHRRYRQRYPECVLQTIGGTEPVDRAACGRHIITELEAAMLQLAFWAWIAATTAGLTFVPTLANSLTTSLASARL
eukprot:COSAG05_NODE_3944_length_1760_cov_19.908015_4_plen_97_part_00